jgi:hypothetical protein
MRIRFPDNKRFAFTVFDDTDGATVDNVKPVYDFLHELGIKSTKSVWVYPSRGSFGGSSLHDEEYARFILSLRDKGFEIALHSVGDGKFTTVEIREGVELFKSIVGYYPKVHANHASNPDCLYWWEKRFEEPISFFYTLFSSRQSQDGGETRDGECFWGDVAKQHIKYIRNLTFGGIDTLAIDPRMPYLRKRTLEYSNYWFSSSDGHTASEFLDLLTEGNIDRLAEDGGACIIYTHFASGFATGGNLNPGFRKSIEYLTRQDGWFVPVSTLLDYILSERQQIGCKIEPSYGYFLYLNWRWAIDRYIKHRRYHR